jgi:hypothetical protein
MSDIPVQVSAPQTEVSIGEGAAALAQIVQPPPTTVPQSNFLQNPVPAVPAQAATVDEALPSALQYNDPVQAGAAAGHVAVYADKQPGGLADAAQHWQTFTDLADGGKIPDQGDTADTMKAWRKFKTAPASMTPDESATLLNAVSQVGAATAASPDLQFDPVARVKSVGVRGEVKVSYPARLNVRDLALQPLAPPAIDRFRALAQLGDGAVADVPSHDLIAPYLGIDTHQAPASTDKIDEMVAGLADELASTPERVRAQIAAGWDKLKTPAKPWERPFTVRRNGVNPAEDALTDGLPRNLIDAMKGGVASLDFTTDGEPAVTVQPGGGLAVSAPPTERNLRLLRHLYPAFSKGGVTAWLPGEPAPTENASKIPGEVYNDFFLRNQGGHPLFQPGTRIVYDASSAKHPGQDLGPVLTSGPALKMDRLKSHEIDPNKLDDLLESHAWALIPGDNSTKASLIRSGFNPIEHKVGNVLHQLVFGITPEQARAHTSGEIVANAGTYSPDGFRPGDGVSFDRAGDGQKSMSHLAGGDVHWFLDGVDRESEPTTPPPPDVTTTRAQRRMVEVTGDLEATIRDLESQGAQNLRVYAHHNQVDGFTTAWEHVFTDGSNTTSVLTKTPSAEAHAGPVLVRSTEGLPATYMPPASLRHGTSGTFINGVSVVTPDRVNSLSDVKAEALRVDGKAIVPAGAPGDASLVDGKLVVHDPTPAAAKLIAAAKLTGLPDSKIKYPAPPALVKGTPPSMVTISGDRVQPLKQTRPNSEWGSRFGIVFDPAYRNEAGVQELDPALVNHLANVYQAAADKHQAALDLWGLNRIAVTSAYSKTPAYTEWGKLGGSIGLSARHWQDPARLTDKVATLQMSGTIVPNVAPTPAYFLAHELGHVVHGALQFGTDGSGARKELLTLRRSLGKDGIVRGLSWQAWHSPEEMVAEAVSEGILASNPRPLAREILSRITDAYDRVMAARTRRDW